MDMQKTRHLSTDELAERLGLPPETIRCWRRKGQGPAWMPVGRHVRYREVDVAAWEKSRLVSGRTN